MPDRTLRQRIENTKSAIKYLESLSPEERRASVIEMRDAQAGSDRVLAVFVFILVLLFSAGIIYMWLIGYKMSLMSSLGIVGALILNTIGFQYLKSNSIESIGRLQFDDFTDEDVIAYFREREKSNQKALDDWNKKGKYILVALVILTILLFFDGSTRDFAVMFVASVLDLFLIGFVVLLLLQLGKYRKGEMFIAANKACIWEVRVYTFSRTLPGLKLVPSKRR